MSNQCPSSQAVTQMIEQFSASRRLFLDTQHQGVTIYGAGFLGTWACRQYQAQGIPVRQFLDGSPQKHGSTIHDVPVVAPNAESLKDVPFVVITAQHAVKEVEALLAPWGIPSAPFNGLFVATHAERYAALRQDYLEDARSRETLDAILLAMLTGTPDPLYPVHETDMYFALPPFRGTGREIYLDAGAFVGDTVERFIWENLGAFEHIYAFEPGERQFKALQARMRRLTEEWALNTDRVTLENKGITDGEATLFHTFTNDFPVRQGLSQAQNQGASTPTGSQAQTVSIDGYLQGRRLTFLKVDVEGFELDLLRGARGTIETHRPKIAISAYHFPSHFYEIAEFVRSIDPSYRFALRHHAPALWDTILYCY